MSSLRSLAALLLPLALAGQNAPPAPSTVRASGEASVSAKPDRVRIDIGVVTQASTAEAAASRNAAQTTAVLSKLKSILGPAGSLRTANYSLNPELHYAPNGGSPTVTGYSANNTVQLTLDDLALAGKALDAATAAGSNSINGIQFLLKDDSSVHAEALRQATLKAKSNAETIAGAMGLHIVRLVTAEAEGMAPPRMFESMGMAQSAARVPTPVESGSIDVRATVTVTVEVAP